MMAMTMAEAEAYCNDHQHEAPVCVTVQCVRCGHEVSFADDDMRYGPVGEVNDQADWCHDCERRDKDGDLDVCWDAKTISMTVDGMEVQD